MTKIERAYFWRTHIENQGNSGQLVKDYCFNNQLKAYSFYFWKKKFSESAMPSNFAKVKVGPRPASVAMLSFGLTKLELPLGTDLDTLAQLMLKLNGRS